VLTLQLDNAIYPFDRLALWHRRWDRQQSVFNIAISRYRSSLLESYELATPVLSRTKPLIESADGLAVAT
jgi:hypothetical protein